MGDKNGRHRNNSKLRKYAESKARKGVTRQRREKGLEKSVDRNEEVSGKGLLEQSEPGPSFEDSPQELYLEHFLLIAACALAAALLYACLISSAPKKQTSHSHTQSHREFL